MKVNEIFYSLQGEGHWTGTPAVFVRLSGCNLNCEFCDTNHRSGYEMGDDDILAEIKKYPTNHVVITGGEPTMQLTASFVGKLHTLKKFVQIETNGTLLVEKDVLEAIDWVTCSPKFGLLPKIQRIEELKLVYDLESSDDVLERYDAIAAGCRYLQPCDRGEAAVNRQITVACVNYILSHPGWRLSLQTHKILNIQ